MTVELCDLCHTEHKNVKRLFFWDGGTEPDGAGGSSKTGKIIDLCSCCALRLLDSALDSNSISREWIKKINRTIS